MIKNLFSKITSIMSRLNKNSNKPNQTSRGDAVRRNQPKTKQQPDRPSILSLKLPKRLMNRIPAMPIVDFFNCDYANAKFTWYRKLSSQEKDNPESSSLDITVANNGTCFKRLSNEICYTPNKDDVGHYLQIDCHPMDGQIIGRKSTVISKDPVELSLPHFEFEDRHFHEYVQLTHEFRFVSYNILADLYAHSDYARQVLFKHCPSHALNFDYRRQLLLKELIGYYGDIMCLQEVDNKMFEHTLEPYFKVIRNFTGIFNAKGRKVQEGLATLFRNEKFVLIDTHCTKLADLIKWDQDDPFSRENHPIFKDESSSDCHELLNDFQEFRKCIQSNPNLESRFCHRQTILQTTLLRLREDPRHFLLVANTHLYFAPDSDHVRLLQGSISIKYIEHLKYKYYYRLLVNHHNFTPRSRISVIFCGDMNSTPDSGLYKLATSGEVDSQLPDWKSNISEAVENLQVKTNIIYKSAYENVPYTNYVPGFNGCLDYIYYEKDHLICLHRVPLPSHEVVTATEGLPNEELPSDHLALVATMTINDD